MEQVGEGKCKSPKMTQAILWLEEKEKYPWDVVLSFANAAQKHKGVFV